MDIKRIDLLKTPLSNEYKNIIDFNSFPTSGILTYYSPKNIYCNVLLESFEKISITNLSRNIKINNKTTTITLPYKYEDIITYNYIIFYADFISENNNYISSNTYYFFIKELISENDNENNPSCTLSIKWDSWANNLDNIYQNSLDGYVIKKLNDYNLIEQKHFNRFSNNKQPIYYNNNYNNLPIKKENININIGYQMLYAKCILKNDIENSEFTADFKLNGNIGTGDKDFNLTSDFKSLLLNQGKQVLYIPIAVYNPSSNKFYNFKVLSKKSEKFLTIHLTSMSATTMKIVQDELEIKNCDDNNNLIVNFSGDNFSYIEDIRYTFYSPVDCIIYVENNNVNVEFSIPLSKLSKSLINNRSSFQNDFDTYAFVYPIGELQYNENDNDLVLGKIKKINEQYVTSLYRLSDSKTIYYNDKIYDININNNLNVNNTDSTEFIDPLLYTYPFKYITLLYNNEEHLIFPIYNDFNKITYKIDLTTYQPKLKLFFDDKNYFNPYGDFIDNSGNVTYSINAKDDYLIRNGSQEKTSLALNKIFTSLNFFTNTISALSTIGNDNFKASSLTSKLLSSTSSFIEGMVKPQKMYESKMYDLTKTPSMLQLSNRGEDDIYIQDRLIFIKNEVFKNNQYYINAINNIYLYGYDTKSYDSILNNNRFWFDYCKTSNCNLQNITNLDDKKELELVFNRGVFKNHINYVDNTLYFNKSLIHNKDKNNIEIDLAEV